MRADIRKFFRGRPPYVSSLRINTCGTQQKGWNRTITAEGCAVAGFFGFARFGRPTIAAALRAGLGLFGP